MKECFQNKFVLRSSHQDAIFSIAVLHLRWNSLKNTCDGVRFFVNLHVTLSNFEPLLREKLYFITALINAVNYNLCRTPLESCFCVKEQSFADCLRNFLQNFLKYLANFTRKHICWSLYLIKLQAFSTATFKKKLQHRSYLMKFATFLRTLFFREHLFTVTVFVCTENLGKVLGQNNYHIPCWQVFLMHRKILENETAGEVSSGLKTCTAFIVSIFEQNC